MSSIGLTAVMLLSIVVSTVARAGEPVMAGHPVDQKALFRVVGSMYNLDPALLEAIARVESNHQVEAVSPAGAVGLMQLMPATAERFGVQNSRDPVENVLGAARFLDYLRRTLGRGSKATLPELLAAYNAGEGAVSRYRGVPPYAETKEYVRRVLWAFLLDGTPPPRAGSASGSPRREVRRVVGGDTDLGLLGRLARIRRERRAAEKASRGGGTGGCCK